MLFREATTDDIEQMQRVRSAVKENRLPHPGLVNDTHYLNYLNNRGKGWVCESGMTVVGFAICGLVGRHIWALFIDPACEGQGIGKKLHNLMLNWYFDQTDDTVWLSTSPGTRAEYFYRRAGWKETGAHGKNEIRFEMTKDDWSHISHSQ